MEPPVEPKYTTTTFITYSVVPPLRPLTTLDTKYWDHAFFHRDILYTGNLEAGIITNDK